AAWASARLKGSSGLSGFLAMVVPVLSRRPLRQTRNRNAGTAQLRGRFPRQDQVALGAFVMIKWAIIFAIIAVVAGALGFTGMAGVAAGVAKFLFVLALIGFVLFL